MSELEKGDERNKPSDDQFDLGDGFASRSRQFGPAPSSEIARIVYPLSDVLRDRPGVRAVLACRVSNERREGKLPFVTHDLYTAVKRFPVDVVAVHARVWPGNDPIWLTAAVEMAAKFGAVIVAETVDRLLRPMTFGPRNSGLNPDGSPMTWWDEPLRRVDLAKLAEVVGGVRVATILDPLASAAGQRKYETERGQRIAEVFPASKRRQRWKPMRNLCMELARHGHSPTTISDMTFVPRMTVENWFAERWSEPDGMVDQEPPKRGQDRPESTGIDDGFRR